MLNKLEVKYESKNDYASEQNNNSITIKKYDVYKEDSDSDISIGRAPHKKKKAKTCHNTSSDSAVKNMGGLVILFPLQVVWEA